MGRHIVSGRGRWQQRKSAFVVVAVLSALLVIVSLHLSDTRADAVVDSRLKTVLPRSGSTVSGTQVVLDSDGGLNTWLLIHSVHFEIDGVAVTPFATKTMYGYITIWNSKTVSNGRHTVRSVVYHGNNRVKKSEPVAFYVSNTTTAPSTTSTTKKTSVTVPPTTTPTTVKANVDTWGKHSGVNAFLSKNNIDRTASLGFGWMKISIEQGEGLAGVRDLITYAHSKGVKIVNACQVQDSVVNGHSGHYYYESNLSAFASYCAGFVDLGVDAIEIGNEWNNHDPFWSNPDATYKLQVKFLDATTTAIRAKSSSVTILNSGFSSAPVTDMPQVAIQKILSQSVAFKQKGTAIGVHSYAWSGNTPLDSGYKDHPEWNPFMSMPDVYNNAKALGYNHPLFITEIGSPSGNGYNNWEKHDYTLETQAEDFRDYILGMKAMRAAGLPISNIMWFVIDDENGTRPDDRMGLFDLNGKLKAGSFQNGTLRGAGQQVVDLNKQPW